MDPTLGALITGFAANGMLSGASLDQSIKQLPARHRIGVLAFAAYGEAADLSNGVPWYAALGGGAVLISLVAAGLGLADNPGNGRATALACLAVLSLGHSLVTSQAAPTYFKIKKANGDEQALAAIFNRFARLQAVRATLQLATLAATAWAIAATIASH